MLTETQSNTLNLIRSTLNKIAVAGSENLGMLLGCIQELDRMIAEIQIEKEGGGKK